MGVDDMSLSAPGRSKELVVRADDVRRKFRCDLGVIALYVLGGVLVTLVGSWRHERQLAEYPLSSPAPVAS